MSSKGEHSGDVSILLDDQLCFALYAASRAIQRLYRPLLDAHGLTFPQYLVLLVLWEEDELGVSEIGARLSLDSATLTPLLKRMESAGLVTRSRSDTDERRVVISLTDDGRALRPDVQSVTNSVSCAAAASVADIRPLTSDLQELVQNLPESLT